MFNSFFRLAALILILSLAFAASASAQTSVTLMQGLNNYTGTTDAQLWGGSPDTNRDQTFQIRTEGTGACAWCDSGVIRFAIFAAEGGPVPDNATITSATLSLYKFAGPDAVMKASRLLKNWNELQVTYNRATTGTSWTAPGANSAGNDYLATEDGQGSIGDATANNCNGGSAPEACWLHIDVTSGVQAFRNGTPNYGWKIAQVSSSSPGNYKNFNTSENPNVPNLRPKLTITYTVPQGSSVTLREGLNGYTGSTDAALWSGGPDSNRDQAIQIRGESTDSAVIRFAIFQSEGGPVPNGATINSATLSMYQFAGPDAVMKASRLLKSWNEQQVTWNVAATGTPWTTPGANSAGNDYVAIADGQGQGPNATANNCTGPSDPNLCWLHIDVTAGVQAFAGGAPNHGWKIAQVSSSSPGNYKNFNSTEHINTINRPRLTVSYSVDCVPPTANLTATPSSGSVPLNVTFNASGSTDESHPITNLHLQFGDGTPDANWTDKNQTQPHTYAGNGTFTATLTATNACGTSAPVTRTITVGSTGPTAHLTATPQSGTAPLIVTFNASGSTQGSSAITSLTLVYGDGASDTWTDKNQTKQHTYSAAGTYTATLTVTDANGLTDSDSKTIPVEQVGEDIAPTTPAAGAIGMSVPTFHSVGLYYQPASTPANGKVWMRYRKASESNSAWREGYPLWFDPRTSGNSLPYAVGGQQYRARGSAVHLQPRTKYYFELGTGTSFAGATWHHHVAGTTWSETFPQDPVVVTIPSKQPADGPFVIAANQGGTASAYKVYDGWNGSSRNVIDRSGAGLNDGPSPSHDSIDEGHLGTGASQYKDPSFGIVIKASYVIVRRVVVKGAAAAAIVIYPNVTNVVIEDTEISDWSWRKGTTASYETTNPNSWGTWGVNEGGGVHLSGNNSRIVVQRSVIKDPHFGAFPWDTAVGCGSPNNHPLGPIGISIQHGGQQNVFRYNEITGHATDNRRWLLDGISGGDNFSSKGSPGADSDIYQNIIMRVFDDAMENEGGGRNVRIWGNYIDQVRSGIAATTVHFGPSYVWRNVINRMRVCYQSISNTDNDWMPQAFKWGGYNDGYGHGIRYLFHNTLLQQPSSPADSFAEGAGRGTEGVSNGAGSVTWTIAHNNILHVRHPTNGWSVETGDSPTGSVFSHNVYNGRYDTHLPAPDLDFKFTEAQLFYKPGHGWSSVPQLGGGGTGNYQLDTGSKGQDTWASGKSCARLPNFNDGFIGSAPDCGAHENGAPPMKFGISATP